MLKHFFQFFLGRGDRTAADKENLTAHTTSDAFAKLKELSPIKDEGQLQGDEGGFISVNKVSPSILCREAVLNNEQKVIGYTFTLTRGINERARKSSASIQRLYDDTLFRNILRMDIHRLLGHRLAFIPVLPFSLGSPILEQLPKEGVVLVIKSTEALLHDSVTTLFHVTTLKKSGFLIAFQGDITSPAMKPFLELAEFFFIDIESKELPEITTQINTLNSLGYKKNIVATNIKTLDEFLACSKLPFQYVQGVFITSRQTWDAPRMDAGRIRIINLLNLIQQDADNLQLAREFKYDPALLFKIMRYINSAGSGLVTKVNTIDQALLVLGRRPLYRWLTLLLFTSKDGDLLNWALMENALVRARLAELCAIDSLSVSERDELFVAGIFSLMDILLHLSMEQALAQVSLPSLVVEALLHQRGKYSPYLELAIACEAFDQERILALSTQLQLSPVYVNAAHVDALVWAEQINE